MEIDKLPNVKKYWINDGYLNIELKDNHLLRMNFNNMETLKKQLTLTDVVSSSTIKKGKIDDLGTSNRRLDRDIDDKFMYGYTITKIN